MPSPDEMSRKVWDTHYTREKSVLSYPDENLVRMLARVNHAGEALDFGAGSGRHIRLLSDSGFTVTAADYSANAVAKIGELFPGTKSAVISRPPYPFLDNQFSLIVNWGILHYNTIENSRLIVREFKRILAPGGTILGSIRSDRDTHLETAGNEMKLQDLAGGYVRLYSENEVRELFSGFGDISIGYTERTLIGDLDKKICHWIFQINHQA